MGDIGPKDINVNVSKLSVLSNNDTKKTNSSGNLKTETILESDHSLISFETFSKKDIKKEND